MVVTPCSADRQGIPLKDSSTFLLGGSAGSAKLLGLMMQDIAPLCVGAAKKPDAAEEIAATASDYLQVCEM